MNADPAGNPRQRFLGRRGFLVFLAFLGAFVPLSTDAYLPALPQMVSQLGTTALMVNLTLVVFFVVYAAGMLFWGPMSDRYGRRPTLLVGMILYTTASVLAIFSPNVETLIVLRVFQALGCGAATTVSTAMVKDSFAGSQRARTLAVVQTLSTTSPVVSPLLGALLLGSGSWRSVFWVFGAVGVVSIVGCLFLEETLRKKLNTNVVASLARLGTVARNRGLVALLAVFAGLQIPFLGFITASSFIYVDGFGVSTQVYSYFFAANAVFLLLGPLVYLSLSRRWEDRTILTLGYSVIAASGLAVLTWGHGSPFLFCALVIPSSLFANVLGPPRLNLLLEQVEGDTGSAVALISFVQTLFGAVGMFVMPLGGAHQIELLGTLSFVVGVASVVAWQLVSRQSFIKHVARPSHDQVRDS